MESIESTKEKTQLKYSLHAKIYEKSTKNIEQKSSQHQNFITKKENAF